MDPRVMSHRKVKDMRSDLMKAKGESDQGAPPNFCPFDADPDHLNDQGYCEHLVGFSNDQETMEPVKYRPSGHPYLCGEKPVPIPKGAKLVRVTTSYRVYHQEKEPAKNGG